MRSHTDNDFIGSPDEFVQIIDANWNQRKLDEYKDWDRKLIVI